MKTLCSAIMALCIASSGLAEAKQCAKGFVQTPRHELLPEGAPGYALVRVLLIIPTPGRDPSALARNGIFNFALATRSTKIKQDLNVWVRGVRRCPAIVRDAVGRAHDASEVWVQVIGKVVGTGPDGFALGSQVLLPNEVVERQAPAYTTLDSGVVYVGEWSREGENVLLTLKPVTSRP